MRYSRDFIITAQDTRNFYRMLMLRRWCKGAIGFAVVGALVARLYMDWLDFSMGTAGDILFMVMTGIITAAATLAGIILRSNSKINAAIHSSGREQYLQQFRIDGFGIHVTVGRDTAKLGFSKIHHVKETRNAFYIFITEKDAWILPKAQMEDAAGESRTLREIFTKVVIPGKLQLQK